MMLRLSGPVNLESDFTNLNEVIEELGSHLADSALVLKAIEEMRSFEQHGPKARTLRFPCHNKKILTITMVK